MHPCQDLKSLHGKTTPFGVLGIGHVGEGQPPSEAVVVGVVSGDIEVEETRQAKLILPVTQRRGVAVIVALRNAVALTTYLARAVRLRPSINR